ncbi:hypothetical protein [Umezawaea tangerina]|uniref:Uncharacterized protein n=1 Tax=Umezawaea tangerina TaxID=84725 RepID=A0A2T0TH57_9PSEU|nr:hypothetical protein [Umezawaea tangerina]PRY44959.1 hypothetical protein CLV43_102524 [Umezawaea tangerina]
MNIDIPPRRALPADLREHLRAEFEQGVDERPRRPVRVPVVAAAAAVVLLAGTVFVLRQMPDAETPAAVPPAFDPVTVNIALDRCWNAVRDGGAADRFPDRSRWTPSFSVGDAQLGVVAARADGRPFFCQTTPTTATVSDPAAAPDTGVAAVLASREGVVAGVLDAGRDALSLEGKGVHGSAAVTAVVGDRMFVALTGINPTGTTFTSGDKAVDQPLAAPPPPAAAVRDHPDGPAPDRASETGRMLGDCLSRSANPVLDPDSYQPVLTIAHPGGTLVIGRTASTLAACGPKGAVVRTTIAPLVESGAVMPDLLVDVGGGRQVLGGEIGDSSMVVATAELGFAGGQTRQAAVAGRIFAVLVPEGVHLDPESSAVHVVLRGANGGVLLEGDWALRR